MRGIGLILISTLFLVVADVASKYLAASLPAAQVTWLRYFAFLLCMLPLAASGRFRGFRTKRPGMQLLRGATAGISSLIFIMALARLPIADATATAFVSPLLVTALSIPFLGEQIGWRRWLATLAGLAGVLVIVRPGAAGFQPASLLPALSALSWAFVVILTRLMRDTESPITTLTYTALTGTILLSLIVPFDWRPLDFEAIALGAFIGITSTIGHWFVVSAFRHGDASLLAPFSYFQLLGAAGLGYLVFGAVPDLATFAGAAIIIASSLYTLHRERVRGRTPPHPPAPAGRASS